MEQSVAGVLARFAHAVREQFADAVIDIRLFGSHAGSTAHEDSDVDVAVVLEEAGWETRRDIIDLAADIGLAHGLMLSCRRFVRNCRRSRAGSGIDPETTGSMHCDDDMHRLEGALRRSANDRRQDEW